MSRQGLHPAHLAQEPIFFHERNRILIKLYETLRVLRPRVIEERSKKLAKALELMVAKNTTSPQDYRFNMSIVLRDLKKYKCDLNKLEICGKPFRSLNTRREVMPMIKPQVMEKLKALLLTTKELETNGYFTSIIADSDSDQYLKHASCIRCGTRFEKSQIMSETICKYHPSKKLYNYKKKTHEYPCCGESVSSTSILRLGCKTHSRHVFRGETMHDLCSISPFMSTDFIDGEENVFALDCEMAFTSKGYEMIRLTIVDFFTSNELFDEIVKPIGEVIDLNSDFSGVHEIDENKALSFAEVMGRVLIPQLINKNSILIGHGLENDLAVMRLVHLKVIDTAVMYSRGKYKTSLKNLAFEHLSEKIQNGEHDSSQDAIATMNVVKKKLNIPLDQKNWD